MSLIAKLKVKKGKGLCFKVSSLSRAGALIGDTVNENNKLTQINANHMLVFEEKGTLEYPGENLFELSREPTNLTYI